MTNNLHSFLGKHGYEIAKEIPQDASTRHYYRIEKNGRGAIVMVDDPAELRVGYRILDFIRIAEWLNSIGLNAPDIYETDMEDGFVILEDLGTTDFMTALKNGESASDLYGLAHEVLKTLRIHTPPFDLPLYKDSHVHELHRDVMRWYYPSVAGKHADAETMRGYEKAWEEIEAGLPDFAPSFLHMDYHVENLMYRPDLEGLPQCGLLDFQLGMIGHPAYDLVNLLEDARMDVPQEVQEEILAGYNEEFLRWYRVLGTQFHCRVIGLFVKLAAQGKPKYLEHIPRLQNYIARALREPLLRPLAEFFDDAGLDFEQAQDVDLKNL